VETVKLDDRTALPARSVAVNLMSVVSACRFDGSMVDSNTALAGLDIPTGWRRQRDQEKAFRKH
jgi:hypothetical protein